MNNHQFTGYHDDVLEVSYAYVGADKAAAGRAAAFTGVSRDISLKNVYADLWESEGIKAIESLAETPETLRARNRVFSRAKSVPELVAAFKKFISKEVATFKDMDVEDESTPYNCKVLLESGVIPAENKRELEFLKAQAAKYKGDDTSEAAEEKEDIASEIVSKVAGVNTLDELTSLGSLVEDALAGEVDSL